MTVSAEALRELMALGIRGEKLAAVVTIFERESSRDASRYASRDGRDAKQKAADRARAYRNRKRDASVTNVTRDASAHIDTSSSLSKEPKIKKESKKTISLSADWTPTTQGRTYAKSKGWNDQRIDVEAERFRDHSLAAGRKHADVEAAWRKWVTSPYQAANGARASPGNLPRPGSREDRQEKTHNAYQKLRQYAHPQADGPADGDAAGDPSFGLLPFPKPARS